MTNDELLKKERRYYHHKIVDILVNKGHKPVIEWHRSHVIDYTTVYWALRCACALTDYEMENFEIKENCILITQLNSNE